MLNHPQPYPTLDTALSNSQGSSIDWLNNNLQASSKPKKQPLMPSYPSLISDLLKDFRYLSRSTDAPERIESICQLLQQELKSDELNPVHA